MAAAADGLFRPIFEGCISAFDNDVERRPYHKNCGCALHSKSGKCTHKLPRSNSVSYPMRRAWSEGSLTLSASSSPLSSPSSSPAAAGFRSQQQQQHRDHEEGYSNNKLRVLF